MHEVIVARGPMISQSLGPSMSPNRINLYSLVTSMAPTTYEYKGSRAANISHTPVPLMCKTFGPDWPGRLSLSPRKVGTPPPSGVWEIDAHRNLMDLYSFGSHISSQHIKLYGLATSMTTSPINSLCFDWRLFHGHRYLFSGIGVRLGPFRLSPKEHLHRRSPVR